MEEAFGEEPEEEVPEEEPAEEEEEGIAKKSGPELFKEVLRLMDTVDVEDYFKNGRWDDVLMRMDHVLLEAHRKEAGASDPPDLKDVKLPANMPRPMGMGMPGMMNRPGFPGLMAVRPAGAVAATGAAGGHVAELRLISLFVAKWQLDPTPTKTVLAKLTPPRRRYVIQSFKATAKGAGAGDELKTYIAKCEKTNAWAAAEKAAAMAASRPATPTRPVSAPPPAWTGAQFHRPSVLGGGPARPGAAIRPMIRPMGGALARPATTFARPGAFARPATIVGPNAGLKRPISMVSGPMSTGASALRQRIASQAPGGYAQAPGAGRVGPASFQRPVTPRPAPAFGARATYGTTGAGARFAGTGAGYAAQVGRVQIAQPATIRPVTPGAYKPAAAGYGGYGGKGVRPATPRPAGGAAVTPRAGGFAAPRAAGTAMARASSAPARPAPKAAAEKPGGLIRDLLQRL